MKTICIPFLAVLTACGTPAAPSDPSSQLPPSERSAANAAHSVISAGSTTEPFTRYLGELRFSSGTRYRVVTQFRKVQGAVEQRGHSSLTIRDTMGRIVRRYEPDLPEQLPTGVLHNKLVFHFDNKRYLLPLEEKLPVLLCIPLDQGCY